MDDDQVRSFWSKVDISTRKKDCWEWRGARKKSGYGNVRIDGIYRVSHRVAFELANGDIPDGYLVCHICDNPPCCNPTHLMLGVPKSNAADMLIKNRQKRPEYAARGERNANAKLTSQDVAEIRRRYQEKEANQYQLAEAFGVSQASIGAIIRRKTWRHVT